MQTDLSVWATTLHLPLAGFLPKPSLHLQTLRMLYDLRSVSLPRQSKAAHVGSVGNQPNAHVLQIVSSALAGGSADTPIHGEER